MEVANSRSINVEGHWKELLALLRIFGCPRLVGVSVTLGGHQLPYLGHFLRRRIQWIVTKEATLIILDPRIC